MKVRSVMLGAAIAATAACGSAPEKPASEGDDIVNGTSASAYPEAVLVDLMQGSRRAAACSGALVAPNVVLTAGHCVHGFSAWRITAPFAAGQRATSSHGETLDWTADGEAVDPTMHDVGLIFLDAPIQLDAYPKLADAAASASETIVNVGRIRDGALSDTQLFVSKSMRVKSAASVGYPYDYLASDVIEPGDSGGPDLLTGAAPHTIVAVNSGGGSDTEVLARVDLVKSWIASRIAGGAAAPASSCAHDPLAVGARLKKSCDPCVTTVCTADSYCCVHTWDEDCVDEASRACGGCGDVGPEGTCDGETLLYCDGGELTRVDCDAFGLACSLESGGYDCR